MLKIYPKYNNNSINFFEREKDRLPDYATTTVSIPEFDSIPAENWVAGNDSIQEMVNRLHPTFDSEDKRNDVIAFMKTLLKNALKVKVIVYGSVPLKTYLPQGDIDLTLLGTSVNNNFLQEVVGVLQAEEQKNIETFQIRDIRFIDAEVKVVKCTVDGITVDMTFNQLGGLCSLCFLEQIDRLIAKNHLFKRSIMVIKAWCYYESHILGASHGLISTYGLEILILFIFHMYNDSLTDPLMVLYRFLEYYSTFDWSNFCVGMDGPLSKESLPRTVVDNPIKRCLLGGEDLRNVINVFMVPEKKSDKNNVHNFKPKFLNVVDPLKDHNNLGRSVYSNTDFMRIKSAFRYGARRLGAIMNQSSDNVREEIKMFFKNTFKLNSSTYIREHNPLAAPFSPSSVSEVSYEPLMLTTYANEYNEMEKYHVSNLDPMEGSDNLSLEPSNDQHVLSDDLSDLGNPDKDCVSEECEKLASFADLTGYYDKHVRSLLHASKFLGFGISTVALLDACKDNGWQSKPGGSIRLNPNAPPFVMGESSTAHGTGSFISVMDTVTKGKGRRPKTSTYPMQQGRKVYREIGCVGARANKNSLHDRSRAPSHMGGHMGSPEIVSGSATNINIPIPFDDSGAPNPVSSQEIVSGALSHVNIQRKLVFGSFGPDPKIDHNDAPNSVSCFTSEINIERIRDQLLELKSEAEFPALSV